MSKSTAIVLILITITLLVTTFKHIGLEARVRRIEQAVTATRPAEGP